VPPKPPIQPELPNRKPAASVKEAGVQEEAVREASAKEPPKERKIAAHRASGG
jgi:hypothetical protein